MYRISIIIPVFNVSTYLRKCFDSILNQTFQDFEIIIVSDGPEEDDLICEEYYKKFPDKITHYIKGIRKGLGGARNAGLKVAKGEYILFVDSDDWIDNNALELLYKKAINKNADVVLTGETLFNDKKNILEKGYRNFKRVKFFISINEKNFIKYFTPAWGRLYKKSFLEKYNLQFVENCRYEDNSWGCFILLFAKKYAFCQNIYYYRRRDESSFNYYDISCFDWIKDFYYFCNYLKINKVKSKKTCLAYFWYLINFANYYEKLSSYNKKKFLKLTQEAFSQLKISFKKAVAISNKSKQNTFKIKQYYELMRTNKIPPKYTNICFLNFPIFKIEDNITNTSVLLLSKIPILKIKR